MTIKEKYYSINQSNLSNEQITFLKKIKDLTNDFETTDTTVLNKAESALDKIINVINLKQPEALKQEKEVVEIKQPEVLKQTKKVVKTKKPVNKRKSSSTTTQKKPTIFSKAKEIRKEGESWESAKARATKMIKGEKEEVVKVMNSELKSLLQVVRRRKELKAKYGKKSYELGGAFMNTDLAGHTGGGTGGLDTGMPLSGTSGTYYTGLVGETGAMSSGEMFKDGGSVDMNFDLTGYYKAVEFDDFVEAKDYVNRDRKKYPKIKESVIIRKNSMYEVWFYPQDKPTGYRVYEPGGSVNKDKELISSESFYVKESSNFDKAIDELIPEINKSLKKKGISLITTNDEFDKEFDRVYVDDNIMIRIWSTKKTKNGVEFDVSVFKENYELGGETGAMSSGEMFKKGGELPKLSELREEKNGTTINFYQDYGDKKFDSTMFKTGDLYEVNQGGSNLGMWGFYNQKFKNRNEAINFAKDSLKKQIEEYKAYYTTPKNIKDYVGKHFIYAHNVYYIGGLRKNAIKQYQRSERTGKIVDISGQYKPSFLVLEIEIDNTLSPYDTNQKVVKGSVLHIIDLDDFKKKKYYHISSKKLPSKIQEQIDSKKAYFERFEGKKYEVGGDMSSRETFATGGYISLIDFNDLLDRINKESEANFRLDWKAGNYELWGKDKNGDENRIEVGKLWDMREALIKNKYNKKYTKYGIGDEVDNNFDLNGFKRLRVFADLQKAKDYVDESRIKFPNEKTVVIEADSALFKDDKDYEVWGTESYKNDRTGNRVYANGGAMMANQQVINDASQSYVNYYLGEGASQGIYKDGGSIIDQYEGRTPEDIWNNWTLPQKLHFLSDHTEEVYGTASVKGQTNNEINEFFAKLIYKKYDDLPINTKVALKMHTSRGQYAKGGSVGDTIYDDDNLTIQKYHYETMPNFVSFKITYFDNGKNKSWYVDSNLGGDWPKKYYDTEVEEKIIKILKNYLGDDYANGGSIPNNYEGRTPEDVWNNWTVSQKEHFVKDNFLVLSITKPEFSKWNESFMKNAKNNDKYDSLSEILKKYIDYHISEGQYAKGGSVGDTIYKDDNLTISIANKFSPDFSRVNLLPIEIEFKVVYLNDENMQTWYVDNNFGGSTPEEYHDTEVEEKVIEVIKDYLEEDYANGGSFAPNVSNGTQFMSGVYANGGSVGDTIYDDDDLTIQKYHYETMPNFVSFKITYLDNGKKKSWYVDSNLGGDWPKKYYDTEVEQKIIKILKNYLGDDYADGGSFAQNVSGSTAFMDNAYFAEEGQYAKSGAIKNQYEGRTAEDVWNNWTVSQKEHFVEDHFLVLSITKPEFSEWNEDFMKNAKNNDKYDSLSEILKKYIDYHISKGQYAKGGQLVKNKDGEYLWFFNWKDGGFNEVFAKTKAQAIKKAKQNGYPSYMPDNEYARKRSLKDVQDQFGKEAVEYIRNGSYWSNAEQKKYSNKDLKLTDMGFSRGLVPNENSFYKQSEKGSIETTRMGNMMSMANGGGIEEYKPNVFYFYYDGNEMIFNTLEQALKEAKQYGAMKVRDNLGGEYFLNYADGGSFAPNVSNGTQFMSGVYAKGGDVEDYYEQLAVYVQGVGSIYNGKSMKKALEKANSYLKNNPNSEITIVDEKYGDEYDFDGNLKEDYAKGGDIDGGMNNLTMQEVSFADGGSMDYWEDYHEDSDKIENPTDMQIKQEVEACVEYWNENNEMGEENEVSLEGEKIVIKLAKQFAKEKGYISTDVIDAMISQETYANGGSLPYLTDNNFGNFQDSILEKGGAVAKVYLMTGIYGAKGIPGKVLFAFKKDIEKQNFKGDVNSILSDINNLWSKWSINEGAEVIKSQVTKIVDENYIQYIIATLNKVKWEADTINGLNIPNSNKLYIKLLQDFVINVGFKNDGYANKFSKKLGGMVNDAINYNQTEVLGAYKEVGYNNIEIRESMFILIESNEAYADGGSLSYLTDNNFGNFQNSILKKGGSFEDGGSMDYSEDFINEEKNWNDPDPYNIGDEFMYEFPKNKDWKNSIWSSLEEWMHEEWGPNAGIENDEGFDDCYDTVQSYLSDEGYSI